MAQIGLRSLSRNTPVRNSCETARNSFESSTAHTASQPVMEEFDMATATPAAATFRLGGDMEIHRLGFGAMRITGKGIWGEPKDREEAKRVLRRAVELGVDFIDTADSYGPDVSE